MFSEFLKFWDRDRSLTALLVLLAVNLLALSPASRLGYFVRPLTAISLYLLLLAGMFTMKRHSTFRIVGIGFVLLTLALRIVRGFAEYPWLRVTELVSTGVCFALILYVVSLMVYGEGPVTGDRIRGAVALYLLIAAFFTVLYTAVEILFPGAFRFPTGSGLTRNQLTDTLTYFSFVTLTTVGYGDITAVHPFARTLVMFEALIGQLYPAILLARLVTLYQVTKRPGKGEGGGKKPSGE